MEMHVVHFKSSYATQEKALSEKDGLVVLVYFFQIRREQNPSMQTIVEALKKIESPNTSVNIEPQCASYFVRPFAKNYLMYWGALKTSSCSHRILWVISREPIGISSDQLECFRKLKGPSNKPIRHHTRTIQPMEGRTLFLVSGSSLSSPESDVLLPIPSKPSSVVSILGPGYKHSKGMEKEVSVPPTPPVSPNKNSESEKNLVLPEFASYFMPKLDPIKESSIHKLSQVTSIKCPSRKSAPLLNKEESKGRDLLTSSMKSEISEISNSTANEIAICETACLSLGSLRCNSETTNVGTITAQTSDSEINMIEYSVFKGIDACTQIPSSELIQQKYKLSRRRKDLKSLASHKVMQAVRVHRAVSSKMGPHRHLRTSKKPHSTKHYIWPFKYLHSCSSLQIPINFVRREAPGRRYPPLEIGNLVSSDGYATIANIGITVEIKLHKCPLPLLHGGPLDDVYTFNHVHFHWDPEVDPDVEDIPSDLDYSMEAHAVYIRECYANFEEARLQPNGIAVVAVFLQECELSNKDFEKVVTKLDYIKQPNTNVELPSDALAWMDNLGTTGYFTHSGTQKSDKSSITWILYPEPIPISYSQADAFRELKIHGMEFGRAVKSLTDQTMYFSI